VNGAPVLDLDSTDGSGPTGYTAAYTTGGTAAPIAGTNVSITDVDDANVSFATIDLTTGDPSDALGISGALPPGISAIIDPPAGGHIIVHLNGSASKSAYQTALPPTPACHQRPAA
jgi:hypothetical protein